MERVSDYDYDLPEELIAQTPLADRAASRLLHLSRVNGEIAHRTFRDAVDLLRPGDLLVMNETRVSAVRLNGQKKTGGAVEALLLHELSDGTYAAMLRSNRRMSDGTRIVFEGGLEASVVGSEGPSLQVRFDAVPGLRARLEESGRAPLPPYIRTPLADRERYQTVYGRVEGSAAAPTAGLHFTREILTALAERGVGTARVTLHVGTDTFQPVRAEDPATHLMNGEMCTVPEETAERVARASGRIIAVGTTTVRTLESFAIGRRRVAAGEMCSKLYIRPGFSFQVVDGMFTNFHMPRTTMLMMISALAGRDAVLRAYMAAVENRYRFLSFGDSMLIL
jgi:S-adenosylmethionine:tRNA ribosyltransferase-isomerase